MVDLIQFIKKFYYSAVLFHNSLCTVSVQELCSTYCVKKIQYKLLAPNFVEEFWFSTVLVYQHLSEGTEENREIRDWTFTKQQQFKINLLFISDYHCYSPLHILVTLPAHFDDTTCPVVRLSNHKCSTHHVTALLLASLVCIRRLTDGDTWINSR